MFWYFAFKKKLGMDFKLVRVRGDARPLRKGFLNRILYDSADFLIASNDTIGKAFKEVLSLDENKIRVLYGGVDLEIFKKVENQRDRIRNEFGYKQNDFVIGIVGRFDPVKGHETLFKAVGLLKKEKKDINYRILVAGFDAVSTRDDIIESATKADVIDLVDFTGKREDIASIMNGFDLGVVPSCGSEAIARTTFEMMACKVPVIASQVGVLPDIIPSDNVFRTNDFKDMASKIKDHSSEVNIFDEKEFVNSYLSNLDS